MSDPNPPLANRLPLFLAADLQDHMMTACSDLDRLQDLLGHACDVLLEGFQAAAEQLGAQAAPGERDGHPAAPQRVQDQLGSAIAALQFQDMASQLIDHTRRRLRSCADRLAFECFNGDDDDEAVVAPEPLRPNPVAQAQVDGGSVELF
jgi:hypothetical protein